MMTTKQRKALRKVERALQNALYDLDDDPAIDAAFALQDGNAVDALRYFTMLAKTPDQPGGTPGRSTK